jgi:hypothetical protein
MFLPAAFLRMLLVSHARQIRHQRLLRKIDTAFHSSDRDIELLCNFLVLVSVEVHDERHAILFAELIDELHDLFVRNGAIGRSKGGCRNKIEHFEVVFGSYYRASAYGFSIVVDKGIAHYGVQPRLQIRVGRELVFVGKCFEQCLLQEVLRLLFIFSKTQGQNTPAHHSFSLCGHRKIRLTWLSFCLSFV